MSTYGPDFERGDGPLQVIDRAGRGGEVKHEIHRTLDVERLRNIVLDEAEFRNSVEMGDVPGVAGDEIIKRDHMESVGQQAVDQVGADEAGTAGDHCGLAFEVLGGIHAVLGGGKGGHATARGRMSGFRTKPTAGNKRMEFRAASGAAPRRIDGSKIQVFVQ